MEFNPFLFLTMHFVLLLFPSFSFPEHSNLTDHAALLAFKADVGDPYGVLSRNWTTNTSFCTWTGVSCSHRRQRVVALDIRNLPLYGTISPNIANMSFLSYLILSNLSLVGPIPDTLSQLPHLERLVLQNNQLSSSIPPAIFNMSLLISLYLNSNSLSGTLPSNHSLIHPVLPRVQNLSLLENQLTGNIPSWLSSCAHLRGVSLTLNKFFGGIPSELGNLKKLEYLHLAGNNLTGTIPASLGNLTALKELQLSSNSLHGNIPVELGRLSNLSRLFITDNYDITGPLPISFSNLSSLTAVDLSYGKLTGPIRVNFGNMPRLQKLVLGGNKLNGGFDFLESLSNCGVLRTLVLWDNELDGSIPNTVGNLSRKFLQFVVDKNQIKGKIPAGLGNLSSLQILDLGNNELDGTIPSEVTMLENLQELSLLNNRIYGSIPRGFSRLRILNNLYLSGNSLSGSIPDMWGNISSLEHLWLDANSLSSSIPHSLWSLTHLIELDLSQNLLSGTLSSAVGNLKALDRFNISMNQLSGVIPSALKELQLLTVLDISNNSFDGGIPQSFGELINIAVLNLSCNNFSGAVSDSLANLRHLISLNLSFNKLEGKVPSRGAFLNHSVVSLVGNAALCGAPLLGFSPCSITAVSNSRSRVHLLWYILPAVASAVILMLAFCFLLKLKRKPAKSLASADTPSPNNYRLISYHELVRATDDFSEANLLGRGGFGSVYKGCLDDGLLIAVKVLNLEVEGASRSFDAECSALRMVRHRNLVKIITTCSNLDFRALVLQFMPNGSLETWLYSHNYCLSLFQRINIVIDVASALDYLHHHHSHVVLHCDLKPSNILLDEEMTAHLSDFGLAKLLVVDSQSVTSTSTPGTIGYIAPEYASTGRVSRKADVYGFGIVLLEIITRKKPTDPMFGGETSLRQWIFGANPTSLLEIVDSNLLNDGAGNERPREDIISMHTCLSSIVDLGLSCSKDSPKERPVMKDIVQKLQNIKMDYLSIFPNV